MFLRKALLVMLGVILLVGIAMPTEPLEKRSERMTFNYEDNVSGSGTFVNNNKITAQGPHADPRVLSRLADVNLQKTNHGSGSIERELIIIFNESTNKQIDPDMVYAFGLIVALDNHSMVYAPQDMSIGNGYYLTHPVKFDYLLGETSQIENYASKTSMSHEIDYAHGVNMDQVASVEDDYYDTGDAKSLSKTLMNLDGDIREGTANLKMLQGGSRKSKSAWSKPQIYIDQVHTGTFDFVTTMSLDVPVYKVTREDYWLPCCFNGWMDLRDPEKMDFGVDAKGIFDCTCQEGLQRLSALGGR